MKKLFTICFFIGAAIMILSAQSVFAYSTLEGGCLLSCHNADTLHGLHSGSCTSCHPGSAGNTPIPTSNCIACHPRSGSRGLCPLINDSTAGASHGQRCLACHTECAPITTTTTTSVRPNTTTTSVQSTTTTTTIICTYSISPTSKTFRASGGKGAVRVSTANGCDWEATSTYSWITITSGASGSGSGRVSYTVATNPDTTERTGSMDIAGETFTVLQAGRRR